MFIVIYRLIFGNRVYYNGCMNILYCGDKGIAQGVLVSILSLIKNNSEPLYIYIMTINYEDTAAFTKKSAKFLDKLVKEKKSKIFKSPFSEDSDIDSIKIKKTGRSQLKLMSNTWKPQFMVCDYFETFKRLKDHYEMTNWEIVIIYLIYNIYYLIYRQE